MTDFEANLQKLMDTVVEHVEKMGSTYIISVMGEGEPGEFGSMPPFAYTIGMWRNYGAPEIMTFCIHEGVLNEVRDRVRDGLVIHPHRKIPEIVKNFDVVFAEIEGEDNVFNVARRYYELHGKKDDMAFPRMQLVWPDTQGKFPWEEGFEEKFLHHQEELGKWPEKGFECPKSSTPAP